MMPVSRLANTWKCLNLFYSYYFREIFFFSKKKGKGFYFLFFCNASKQGNTSCSISALINVLTVLLTWGFEHFWSPKLWLITLPDWHCICYKPRAKPKLNHCLSSTLSFSSLAFLNLLKKKSNREGVYVWGCVDQHYIVLNNFLHCFWLFIDSGFEACTAELGAGKVHLVQLCHQIAFCFCKLVSGNRDTALSTGYW